MQHNPNRYCLGSSAGICGENLAWQSYSGSPVSLSHMSEAEVTQMWYDEEDFFTYPATCAASKQCGHYTQVIWDTTAQVGCGVKQCVSGSNVQTLFVCDYYPAGNYVGQAPYSPANPTSTCSDGSALPSGSSSANTSAIVAGVLIPLILLSIALVAYRYRNKLKTWWAARSSSMDSRRDASHKNAPLIHTNPPAAAYQMNAMAPPIPKKASLLATTTPAENVPAQKKTSVLLPHNLHPGLTPAAAPAPPPKKTSVVGVSGMGVVGGNVAAKKASLTGGNALPQSAAATTGRNGQQRPSKLVNQWPPVNTGI
eukprot:GILK01015110.1.p1 GENE.GILK01015110.1~~GILK01015110.1.p1  ORF type:complete len:332 (+),score=22.76 GILK01015110.1:66-998(+)